ncbi:hypothetical protein ACPU9B_002986 [Klebsiella michiganensis]
MSNVYDDDSQVEEEDDEDEDDEDGPDSINELYGYDDPEDNEEAAFDDVMKATERDDT